MRAQQLEMAQAIAETIAANSILVAEAGTGTGKTFAYLVPALLGGGKVIISTGTKTLQDQLFNRDIPTVRAALKAPVTVALLKGRANYVCHYHLERTVQEGRASLASREEVKYLKLIERYAGVSKSGDKSGLSEVPENAAVWQQVTSTRDNCLGSECPHHKNCFVMEARKQALAADVVVVNHHLFFADVMLRDEGLAELLPACNTVIFDEAHQLPETASLFFGESVSTSQLLELARDTEAEALRGAKDFAALPPAIAAMEKAARDFRLTVEGENTRMPLAATMKNAKFGSALDELLEKLDALTEMLESQAERSEGLENCWQRAREIAASIKRWRDQAEAEGFVRWVEVFSQALQLNATPLSIAEIFNKQLSGSPRAWIFTSATLSVKGDFSHYNSEMGLNAESIAGAVGLLGKPVRFRQPGPALCAGRPARSQQPGIYRRSGESRPAGIEGQPWSRIFPVHQPAGDAACARTAAGGIQAGKARLSDIAARPGLALPYAGAFPQNGQCRTDRQPILLGRGGCARRSVVAGGNRQAALRPAR